MSHWTSNIEPRLLVGGLKTIRLWLACMSILIGTLIYVAYGTDTLIINKVLRTLHLGGLIDSLRALAPAGLSPLRNQVPDGLWVFAGTTLMLSVWAGKHSGAQFWIRCPLFFGIAGELGQYINVVPGTFDVSDIVSMLIGYILGHGVSTKRFIA
jgi:hypothetical protein